MSTTKHAIIILTFVFLMGVSWPPATLGPEAVAPSGTTEASMISLSLVGTVSAWNASTNPNPTITVTQGDTVRIALTSTDTIHQFALDLDGDGAKLTYGTCPSGDTCSTTFGPGPGTTFTFFTASISPGTYLYFCTFHYAMVGSFVVKAPSQSSAATFVHGKLSWTHHLSVMKTGMQTFTATVEDTGTGNTKAVVHVSGGSFSTVSNAEKLQPGLVTHITFTSAVAGFVGTKICFTATLTFGPTTGLENTSPVTKTGCFAVVP